MNPPVVTFTAYSNTGKTTYLEKLIPCLKQAGLRVAVIKHDGHDFQADVPGKDSWRFARAGADVVAVASPTKCAVFRYQPVEPEQLLPQLTDADLIITEGYKHKSYPKIALYRAASGKALSVPAEECLAIVGDYPAPAPCPVFPLNDPQPLADFLLRMVSRRTGSRKEFCMTITVEQAVERMLAHTRVLETEQVLLEGALGRTLAESLYARYDQPPFDRSPLDGYAVRAEDLAGASPDAPVSLRVTDKLYAGCVSAVPVEKGRAVRLMTGAMIPSGADCVIPQEDTDEGEVTVHIFRSTAAGRNICQQGEEYRSGDLLLPAGQVLDPAAIAVAAGAGYGTLPVRRRMKAVIISTGDELLQPGEPLPSGRIYDSNRAYLQACLRQMDADILDVCSAGDDITRIAAAIDRHVGTADLILTTGGVSVGQKDLLEAAVRKTGAEVIFHGLDMKPGMPTMLSEKGGTLILSLSGNPFSAAVPFFLLVRPMLAHMMQAPSLDLRSGTAEATAPFEKASPVRRFLRGTCLDGRADIPGRQANGQMRSMVGCNCLIDIPAGSGAVRPGDSVRVLML